MHVRFTSVLLAWLLVGAAITPSPVLAERLGRELAASPAETERLYLPSPAPLARAISAVARAERQPRVERCRLEAGLRMSVEYIRSFRPEPPESHDKRPLPRRAGDDPPLED